MQQHDRKYTHTGEPSDWRQRRVGALVGMPLYRVTIHGRNFLLNMEGKREKFGFYTPRFADGPDTEVAEQVALEDFRHSPKYQDLIERSLNSEDDPPALCGEDITQVSELSRKAPAGLAFYRESDA